MNTTTNTASLSDEQIEALKAAALAATPQDIDSAQEVERFPDGSRYCTCPACDGEGHVDIEADFCNYDGHALGVQFYGIGTEHGAAEAYFRAVKPATILALIDRLERAEATPTPQADAAPSEEDEAEEYLHPVTQVYFRAGLLACREFMARFIQHDSPAIAASIRANWWPVLGQDFGAPRKLDWAELTVGEYGEEGFRAKTADEVSPTQEALPIAMQFLQSIDPTYGLATLGIEGLERSLAKGVAAIAAGGAQEPDVLEWLETEVSAVSCRYHGDPSYDHDAYWMKDRVTKLIADARKAFPLPRVAATVMPDDASAFKNFHRQLCERFGYVHDEKDWRRDQVSLIECIAKKLETVEKDSARYRRFRRWHSRLQTSYWTGQWWEPIYGEKMDTCVDGLDEVPQPTPHADQCDSALLAASNGEQ